MSAAPLARSPLDDLADRWQDAWAGRGSFADCCTPDVRYEDPVAVEPLEGVARLAAHAERVSQAFPDLRLERTGPRLGAADTACLPWRLLATQKGELSGLPATGRFVVVHGVHYVELADGLIRRARGFFDLYDVAVQLGVLPARGSLAEAAILLVRGFGLRPRA